ncbi:MAG: hypothetical protein WCH39_16420 [Schlesneria sp.]
MTPDATSLSWWLTQIGPSGMIIFLIWRVLLFLKPIVLDFVPYFKDLLMGHIRLMSLMETHLTNGAIALKKVSETQDGHGELIQKIHDTVVK